MSLIQSLEDLRNRGIRGEILLSQYLNFTDPVALRMLMNLSNLEVRVATKGSMHAKGYFFFKQRANRYLIGSSNWTASALSANTELNVLLEADSNSAFAREVESDFTTQFNSAEPLTKDYIERYSSTYAEAWSRRSELGIVIEDSPRAPELKPNQMQIEALASLKRLRSRGETKALLISATGTGKTLLAAFDAKSFDPRRLLFVVHRENIARAAMDSFRRVFGDEYSYGLYTGTAQDSGAELLFSTVQTLSRQQHLERFPRNEFDYIIVDESHRAGAETYSRFLQHFSPRFLLGMTATPERTDGEDIFRYFNHQIAYEIRLQRALQEDMLCPFHYFGIADITINGEAVDDLTDFNKLTTSERVDRIVEKASFYGCDDGIVRGLIFCSRNEEARRLSSELNRRGYSTVALDGSSSEESRESAIRRLEAPSGAPEKLDYILTVDIFNEGVDIPYCNQIIMLRPTQSAIIFVQQLGRGLRKVSHKDKYLTVIDFIGNYSNNYLIPIALYGDRSYDKDRIRRLVVNGNENLPGTSTINFDQISRERIFSSLNSARTQQKAELDRDFRALKGRLGRIPMMRDFVDHGLRDPRTFAESQKSFYLFSHQLYSDLVPKLSATATKILEIYSRDALNSTSLEESLIISSLINEQNTHRDILDKTYTELSGCTSARGRWEMAVNSLNLRFLREAKNGNLVSFGESTGTTLIHHDGSHFKRSSSLNQLLSEPGFGDYLSDLAEYARDKYLTNLKPSDFVNGFVRYRKYSRQDVFRILGCPENPVAQNVGGYMIAPDQSWCPIFVTYRKDEAITATIHYKDTILSPSKMLWYTKNRRTLKSPDVRFFNDPERKGRICLFVKKSNDDGLAFYYLGDATPDVTSFVETTMKDDAGGQVPVVHMHLDIDRPIVDSLYNYLEN